LLGVLMISVSNRPTSLVDAANFPGRVALPPTTYGECSPSGFLAVQTVDCGPSLFIAPHFDESEAF
jgi:hypothetical protein